MTILRPERHDQTLSLMSFRRMRQASSRSRSLGVLAMAIASAFSTPRPSFAQSEWRPSLRLDNDVYNYWQRHTKRPDEEYTNGVHASLTTNRAPWWGRRFAPGVVDCRSAALSDRCRSTSVTLGQDLYTPRLDRAPNTVPQWELERPYFAWLFLNGTARVSSMRTLHATSLSLGVTGPPAGGALAQDIAHRIGFNEKATGWETQIGFEPGVILGYERQDLLVRRELGRDFTFDVSPMMGIALGNIRTNAVAGATLRFGKHLSHPWHAPAWWGRAASEWWLAAGARAEYVARDMSLDGTLVNSTRRVERIPGVSEYAIAAGLRIRGVTLEYRAITRSREYRSGPGHHTYSSMILSLTPK
jgi:lipid A 3-O-deacylase